MRIRTLVERTPIKLTIVGQVRVKMHRLLSRPLVLCFRGSLQSPPFLRQGARVHDTIAPFPAKTQPFEAIPGPTGPPFIGSVWEYFGRDGIDKMFKVHQELFRKYGPIFKEKLFGRTIVNVMEPSGYEKIFRDEGKFPHRSPVESWLLYRQRRNHCPGLILS